jgi:hypothetical protein
MTQDIPPVARDRAHLLFTDLIEGRGEKVHRELDAALEYPYPRPRWPEPGKGGAAAGSGTLR